MDGMGVGFHAMSNAMAIEFVLKTHRGGVEVTPATIGLSRFNEFNQQVADFLSGSSNETLDDIPVRIEPGSYKLVPVLTLALMTSLEPDLKALSRQDSLGDIDAKRAKVASKWQAQSRKAPGTVISIRPVGMPAISPVVFSRETDYRVGSANQLVRVEKYIFGTVTDIGGATRANVHIRLEDTGQIVKISSDENYLKNQEKSRVYKRALVRIEADKHLKTGELSNLRLIKFEDYEEGYDAEALDRFEEAGRLAWADVSDGAEWVRKLRGGY